MRNLFISLGFLLFFLFSCSEPIIYTVTFDANGGTGTMETQAFTAGVEQSLTENAFTRKNFTFLGWSETKNSPSATYTDKAKLIATKDTTLYAVWEAKWLTFTSELETYLVVTYKVNMEVVDIEYSTDGKNWVEFQNPQDDINFGGEKELYLRGKSLNGTAVTDNKCINFTFKEGTKVHAWGDIQLLVDYENPDNAETSNACFASLFDGCDELVTAPQLLSMKLADFCYSSMFRGCTALTQAPALPAKKLSINCYSFMFEKCTSLTQLPKLPAEELAAACYQSMFMDCTALTDAQELLPAKELVESCYANMFFGCTNLTKAPKLPATQLAPRCYFLMFSGTGLTKAPDLHGELLYEYCYTGMFSACPKLESVPILNAKKLNEESCSQMFSECVNLTQVPELKAETLATKCYNDMFFGCKKLKSVTMLATDVEATDALKGWLDKTAIEPTTAIGTLTVVNETMKNNKIIKASLPEPEGMESTNWTIVAKPTN